MTKKANPYKRTITSIVRGVVLFAAFAGIIFLAVISRPQPALIRLADFTKSDQPDKDTVTTVIVSASTGTEKAEIFQATKATAEEALSAALSRTEESSNYSKYQYFRIDIAYGSAAGNPAAITDNFPALSEYSYFISPTTSPVRLSSDDVLGARELLEQNSRYLAAQVLSTGQFVFARNLQTGEELEDTDYSLPVHAAAISALLRAYSVTHESHLIESAELALEYLINFAITKDGDTSIAYMENAGATAVDLGSTAYTAIALADYHDVTGRTTYDSLLAALASGIDSMRFDGECFLFRHELDLDLTPREEDSTSTNFSAQAALALIRTATTLGRPEYLDIAAPILVKMLDKDYSPSSFWYATAATAYQSAGTKPSSISDEDHATLLEVPPREPRVLASISANIIQHWSSMYSDNPPAVLHAAAYASDYYVSSLDDNQSAIIELYDLLDTSFD